MDGNNPALTSGEAVNGVDIDARNGIIADFLVVTPHNLTVYNVTVRNIYLNGIYGTGISHVNGLNVHDNVVRNVAGTSNSSAINFYGGSGSLANNTVEDGTVGVVCQQESACLIQNNVITDAQRGIVVASNLTFSGATTVTGNAISGGWTGIDVHHQGQPLTISNNRLDRVTRSIAVGGGSSNPLIEGNQINGTGFSDATGIIVETRGHGGSNQATSAILRDNDIYRTNYGVALYSTASKGVTADLESNLISGTLASSVVITGPGTLDVTLGDSLATANTFRNHGGYLVQLIDTADDVPARFNDWGITALGSIETDIYHQVDNAALGEVLYYGLTAAAAPATLPANGVDAATITATLTGLYAPQGNLVTFAASHGTLSATTDTTDPDEATTSITANATGTAAITATAGYRQATASVSFSPPTPHHFRFAPIPNVVAGVDFTVTITAENSNNSVLTAYDGYALLDDATGTVAPTSVGPFAGGVWTGPISITQVYDGNTLTATYPPDTNITGVSDAFDVVLSLMYQYLPLITRE
jgi:hypothetical protein